MSKDMAKIEQIIGRTKFVCRIILFIEAKKDLFFLKIFKKKVDANVLNIYICRTI